MIRITLGEMLRRFRMEKGLEAKQVCEGLCSTAMMSSFEKGKHVPDTLLFEYMMERMGGSPELFSIMVSREEYDYYGWRERVCYAIEERDYVQLEQLLASTVAGKTYCNSKLELQFLFYAKAIYCGIREQYVEATKLLEKAIGQTLSNLDTIGNLPVLLGASEIHMLILYMYYGVCGKVMNPLDGKRLFYNMEKYLNSEKIDLTLRAKTYPKLCCVGIMLFEQIMTEKEQIELCEKSVKLMIEDMSFHDVTNVLRLYIPLLEKNEDPKIDFYKKQYEVFEDILKTENVETEFYAESLDLTSPKLYIIDEYLLSKRRAMNLTQEQISEGICEPETYSRIETGKRAPSKKNLRSFAERLDINWCYYRGELDATNLKAHELRLKQRKANINGNRQECLDILKELENQLDMRSTMNIQYIRSNQYVAEYRLGKLSAEETCSKLKGLLELTQAGSNDLPGLVYYSQTELEIIAQIAQILKHMKQYEKGIDYVLKVVSQVRNSNLDIRYQWAGSSFMLRTLCGLFFETQEYNKALEIAQFVQKEQVKRRDAGNMIETLDEMADCYEHIGEQYSSQYRKLYRYAYYVSDFFKIEKGLEFFKTYYEEKFEPGMEWY